MGLLKLSNFFIAISIDDLGDGTNEKGKVVVIMMCLCVKLPWGRLYVLVLSTYYKPGHS